MTMAKIMSKEYTSKSNKVRVCNKTLHFICKIQYTTMNCCCSPFVNIQPRTLY